MSKIPFRFAPVPEDILFDGAAPSQVVHLYAALYRLWDLAGGTITISQVDLGKRLCWSDDTVSRWSKKAQDLGWIHVRRQGQGRANEYQPVWPEPAELRVQDVSEPAELRKLGPSEPAELRTLDMSEPADLRHRPADLRVLSSSLERKEIEIAATGKRRRKFPDGWEPGEPQRKAATEAGMDAATRRAEWARFADHHLAHGSLMLDWPAAWRTWCSNYPRFSSMRPTNGHGPQSGSTQRTCRVCKADPSGLDQCPERLTACPMGLPARGPAHVEI